MKVIFKNVCKPTYVIECYTYFSFIFYISLCFKIQMSLYVELIFYAYYIKSIFGNIVVSFLMYIQYMEVLQFYSYTRLGVPKKTVLKLNNKKSVAVNGYFC